MAGLYLGETVEYLKGQPRPSTGGDQAAGTNQLSDWAPRYSWILIQTVVSPVSTHTTSTFLVLVIYFSTRHVISARYYRVIRLCPGPVSTEDITQSSFMDWASTELTPMRGNIRYLEMRPPDKLARTVIVLWVEGKILVWCLDTSCNIMELHDRNPRRIVLYLNGCGFIMKGRVGTFGSKCWVWGSLNYSVLNCVETE